MGSSFQRGYKHLRLPTCRQGRACYCSHTPSSTLQHMLHKWLRVKQGRKVAPWPGLVNYSYFPVVRNLYETPEFPLGQFWQLQDNHRDFLSYLPARSMDGRILGDDGVTINSIQGKVNSAQVSRMPVKSAINARCEGSQKGNISSLVGLLACWLAWLLLR